MRIDPKTLQEMASLLSTEDRDEMAIPSFLHKNPALRWMAWRRISEMERLIHAAARPGGRLLDFGCGTGVLLETEQSIAGEVIGTDLVLAAATLWKQRKGLDKVTLLSPDDARAQLAPGSVDTIVAAEVLEHIEPPEPTLAWFRQLLAPRAGQPPGALLVSLPTENAAYRFGRRLAGFDGHFHKHNAAALDRVILAAGFKAVRRSHIPLPGPLSIYMLAWYQPV